MPFTGCIHWRAAACLALTLLVGCDMEEQAREARLKAATAEVAALEKLKSDASLGLLQDAPGTASIFISKRLIQSALDEFATTTIPIEGAPGVTVRVNSIVADFRVGYPALKVDAVALSEQLGLSLKLLVTAHVETVLTNETPSRLMVSLRVDDVVPDASWGPLDFKIRGFVRQLINARVDEELGKARPLLNLVVTREQTLVSIAPKQQTFNIAGGAQGVLDAPGLIITGRAQLAQAISLPDGIHIYGDMAIKVSE
jgi:hypothetical protein